jgi:hypothetical protein
MTPPACLEITLLSDATFSRGEPAPGEVDVEVEHDELGLPFLGGKAVHGLLRDAWLSMAEHFPTLAPAAARILGVPGHHGEDAVLAIREATCDEATRAWVERAVNRTNGSLEPAAVLRALTDVRWQTSLDRSTGGPAAATLRASRVVLRGLSLRAGLRWLASPDDADLCCLAMSALATRHAGFGRNRGRGHIRVTLDGDLEETRRRARQALIEDEGNR